jgi:hypothetical protein
MEHHKNKKDDAKLHRRQEQPSTTSPLSSSDLLQKASRELSKSLMEDLPMLMYGSGDVYPFKASHMHPTHSGTVNSNELETDINTTSILAELTSSFICDLVNAAIDSHDILTDGRSGGGGGIIPTFNSATTGSTMTMKEEEEGNKKKKSNKRQLKSSSTNQFGSSSGRGRNWEEELPMPIILSEPKRPRREGEDWQGTVGLDLEANQLRSKYMTSTATINEKSFLLPVCHDTEMYNRSKEISSFHNSAMGVLFDSGVQEWLDDIQEDIDGNTKVGDGNDDGAEERKRRRKEKMMKAWPGIDENLFPTKSINID